MSSKLHSKLKAVAGHTMWTERETMLVPFYHDGPAVNGAEFATIKVSGRDMLLFSIRVDAQVPCASGQHNTTINLYNGLDTLVPNTTLLILGVQPSADRTFSPGIKLPAGSYWKARIGFSTTAQSYAPQGITLTYQLGFSNGPVSNPVAAFSLVEDGIGYWSVGGDFVVS